MSFKDALWISTFYVLTATIFQTINISESTLHLSVFFILAILFSFIDERISLKMKRWRYSNFMPTILGVGISPLLELAITGSISIKIVFNYFL